MDLPQPIRSTERDPHPPRDLTNPAEGRHCLQHLVEDAEIALRNAFRCRALLVRGERTGERYPAPSLLRQLAEKPPGDWLVLHPGLSLRDAGSARSAAHASHGLDLYRLRPGRPFSEETLEAMVHHLLFALLPGRAHRLVPSPGFSANGSAAIHASDARKWTDVGDTGLGVATGSAADGRDLFVVRVSLDLDRVLMLRKNIDDVRLLRSDDPRVRAQMLDLSPYRPVADLGAAPS